MLPLKHAIRLLRRSPRNTALAVTILAVAIGTNTVMFSAVNHVLFRPFPFRQADHLVRIRDQRRGADGQVYAFNMPAAHIIALRQTDVFDGVVAFSGVDMTLTGGDLPERVQVALESDEDDGTLGVRPAAGRTFAADERAKGLDSGVVVISDALARTRFGDAPAAIGRTIRLDERTFTVIGVMPPQYAFPYDARCWLPFVLHSGDRDHDFAVFGRMRNGVTLRRVRQALDDVAAAMRATSPDGAGYGLELTTVRENLTGDQTAPIRALTFVVGFLLLVACVNVSTLLLAQSVTRRREFAIRAALGASWAQHVRELLVESLLLAGLGCGGGLLLAAWLAPLTSTLVPTPLRDQLGLTTPSIDWRVLGFAIAVSLVSTIVAGTIPAFGGWRTSTAALADGGRTASAGISRRRLLAVLIIAETALTLVLLAGSALVIRNFERLQSMRLGFDASGLLAVEVTLPDRAYADTGRREVVGRIADRVRAAPGVLAAGVTTVNPLGGATWASAVVSEQMLAADPEGRININERLTTPGLFEAMRIPLLRGRTFTDADRAGTEAVAIVSERLARRLWPGQDAIGKRMRAARQGASWVTVVGVAGDVSDSHVTGVPLETWYLPYSQYAASAAAEHVYVMVRAERDALALVGAVERAIVSADKTLAPYAPVAMDAYYAETIARERISAAFMAGFGVFALILAALGVYGVMAFSVSQRTAEIGVRMALGATVGDILPLVLRRAMMLVCAGVAVGRVGALGLNQVLASVLTEISRLDAVVVAGAAVLIVAAAAAACLVPALSAARTNPSAALRAE